MADHKINMTYTGSSFRLWRNICTFLQLMKQGMFFLRSALLFVYFNPDALNILNTFLPLMKFILSLPSLTSPVKDIKKCLDALDEISTLQVTTQHLQKHSELIATLKKVDPQIRQCLNSHFSLNCEIIKA